MTKSTITRERLDKIASGNAWVCVQDDEAAELARMALAAMDSEPVGTLSVRHMSYSGKKIGNQFGFVHSDAAMTIAEGDYPLYRHAQQPVVPDEAQSRAAFEKWCTVNIERNKWHPEFYAHLPAREQWAAWEACRAAMLAAAPQSPGSEPATVPGKWIPVSEQMPDDEQEVLTINKIGHRFVSFFDKHSGLFFDRLDAPAACCIEHVLVTHWMPLPAAPQEVKGE
ncbi:DUF551 domain-containing protein [Klebsiella quasipneumoniae]